VSLGIKQLLAFGDSKVVIEQVNKEWDCIKDTMDAYCVEIANSKATSRESRLSLIRYDLKTWHTEQDLVDYNQSRSTGYDKMCNVDLGLLVVTD
jgi:ribonuclease HI